MDDGDDGLDSPHWGTSGLQTSRKVYTDIMGLCEV